MGSVYKASTYNVDFYVIQYVGGLSRVKGMSNHSGCTFYDNNTSCSGNVLSVD